MTDSSTPYGAALAELLAACGPVETYINGLPNNNPSPAQSAFLDFLQGPMKKAIMAAQSDPNPS